MNIHSTAIVNKNAKLADDVSVGPYTVIENDVNIGPGSTIGPHCVISSYTTIGKGCQIFPGANIGSISQDKKFKGAKSFVRIGDNNVIREYVTINRGTEEASDTVLGNNNLLMAYCHVAHDCRVGNNVVMANCGTLAGHVIVEDRAIIGGLSGVHQFVRVGTLSIIGGCSKAVKDIVPYSMSDGHPAKIYGINTLGLERAEFPENIREDLKKAFKIIFFMKFNITNALKKVEEEVPRSEPIANLIDFIRSSEGGISR